MTLSRIAPSCSWNSGLHSLALHGWDQAFQEGLAIFKKKEEQDSLSTGVKTAFHHQSEAYPREVCLLSLCTLPHIATLKPFSLTTSVV